MAEKKPQAQPPNVLEMIPAHNSVFEEENGRITVLLPRKQNRFVARFFPQRQQLRYFKLHLDDYGTYVWKQMDDRKTVFEIAHELKEQFGAEIDPVYERLGLFINLLAQRRLISLRH
jgi:hypothetical protein